MLLNTKLSIGDMVSLRSGPYESVTAVGALKEVTTWHFDDGIDISYTTEHYSFCESDISKGKVTIKMNVAIAIRIIADYALSKGHVIIIDDLLEKIAQGKRLTYNEREIYKKCRDEIKFLLTRRKDKND